MVDTEKGSIQKAAVVYLADENVDYTSAQVLASESGSESPVMLGRRGN